MVLLARGELVHFVPRHRIESRSAQEIATELTEAFQIGFLVFLPFLVVDLVAGGDAQLREAAEDVELGDDEFGEAVDADGMTHDVEVKPADAAGTSGGGAIFIPGIGAGAAQVHGFFSFQFTNKGPTADAGGEGFGDAHNAPHDFGANAQTDESSASSRM